MKLIKTFRFKSSNLGNIEEIINELEKENIFLKESRKISNRDEKVNLNDKTKEITGYILEADNKELRIIINSQIKPVKTIYGYIRFHKEHLKTDENPKELINNVYSLLEKYYSKKILD